jgi:hypothetical protein
VVGSRVQPDRLEVDVRELGEEAGEGLADGLLADRGLGTRSVELEDAVGSVHGHDRVEILAVPGLPVAGGERLDREVEVGLGGGHGGPSYPSL